MPSTYFTMPLPRPTIRTTAVSVPPSPPPDDDSYDPHYQPTDPIINANFTPFSPVVTSPSVFYTYQHPHAQYHDPALASLAYRPLHLPLQHQLSTAAAEQHQQHQHQLSLAAAASGYQQQHIQQLNLVHVRLSLLEVSATSFVARIRGVTCGDRLDTIAQIHSKPKT